MLKRWIGSWAKGFVMMREGRGNVDWRELVVDSMVCGTGGIRARFDELGGCE